MIFLDAQGNQMILLFRFNIPSPDKVQAELEVLEKELILKKQLISEAENSIKYFIELKSGTVSVIIKLFNNLEESCE